MSLFGNILRPFTEWRAKGKSYAELLQRLEESKEKPRSRMQNASDNARNRERAVHIIGIERWGSHRLRTLLGEPLVLDEYDGYAPSSDLSMTELAAEFERTRDATLAIINELQNKGISVDQTAKHNELGDLSVGGWVFYLTDHASRESLIIS